MREMGPTVSSSGDDEFYFMEEFEQLEDESLSIFAKKFENMRFRKNPSCKYKPTASRFQRGSSSKKQPMRTTSFVQFYMLKMINCSSEHTLLLS